MTDLEQLIHSQDPDDRLQAVMHLKEKGPGTSVAAFEPLLGDPDWRVRKACADALSGMESSEVMSLLIGALYDEENAGKRNIAMETLHRFGEFALNAILEELDRTQTYDVRLALVTLLGDIKGEQAFNHLVYILQTEKEINILSAAVSSIGHYRRFSSIPHLLRVLRNDNPWLQFHCIEALGQVGAPEALQSIIPYYSKPGLQKSVLDAVGQIAHISSVPFLIGIIKNERPLNLSAVRALMQIYHAPLPLLLKRSYVNIIIQKIREIFPKEVVSDLITVLKNTPKEEVRRDLLKLIGWTQAPEGLGPLKEYILHPDLNDVVVQAFIDFGPDAWSAVSTFLDPMQDEDILAAALSIVQSWKDERAQGYVLRLLDHESDRIVQLAMETLSNWEKEEFIPYILSTLSHPSHSVQVTAVKTVVAMGKHDPALKASTLSFVQNLLNHQEINQRINALNIYAQLEGAGYEEVLVSAIGNENATIRQQAVELMRQVDLAKFRTAIQGALADESPHVRLCAIEAMGEFLDMDAFPMLLSALEDPDIWIRAAAARVIGRLGSRKALNALLTHLIQDPPPVKIAILQALGNIKDPQSLVAINQQLRNPDQEVQCGALLALGNLDNEDARKTLLDYLKNDDWRLRATAVQSLSLQGDGSILPTLHAVLKEDPDNFVKEAALQGIGVFHRKESFPYLFWAMNRPELVDEVCSIFIQNGDIYRDQLQQAWQNCDKRQEEIISIILEQIHRGQDVSE